MRKNKSNKMIMCFCVVILACMGTGCSSDTAPKTQQGLPPSSPAALRGAQLLFHRPNGLYLMALGENQTRHIHPHGRYGRWAPNGRSFAFLAGNQIMWQDLKTESAQSLAEANNIRAIAFHPDGRQIFFTDGGTVRSVEIASRQVRKVLTGPEFFELDIASDGSFLAATVRRQGYRVMRFALPSGDATNFGPGCSAGISADNRWITVNAHNHLELKLHDSHSGAPLLTIHAPAGQPLDNQKWSNHIDWIAGIVEQPAQDIMIQFVPDGRIWRVTDVGDADRPDLFIPPPQDHDCNTCKDPST